MKTVLIATTYKGYNFGTSLQAYASKLFISKMGYVGEIIWYKDFLAKGRDIRIRKILMILLRIISSPSLFKKTILIYKNSFEREIGEESKVFFKKFAEDKLNVKKMYWYELKKYAKSNDVIASICGSDQIWNATNIYIDPIYYLKFSPQERRVAYAPSFGKDQIPNYNKNIIKKNIEKIKYISVREEQGVNIIKELLGKDVPVMLDPTLLIQREQWINESVNYLAKIEEDYILLYFLDSPSQMAMKYINRVVEKFGLKVIAIPNMHTEFQKFPNYVIKNVGPLEFVNLVAHAKFVCTDSFHGTAFSVNLNIPFITFKREYGAASDQSSRIISLLSNLKLEDRYISDNEAELDLLGLSFEVSEKILENEREKAKEYLIQAFTSIESLYRHEGSDEK